MYLSGSESSSFVVRKKKIFVAILDSGIDYERRISEIQMELRGFAHFGIKVSKMVWMELHQKDLK